MLRWHLQEGRSAIPKSTKPARIAENFDVFDFELTPDSSRRSTRSTRACGADRIQPPSRSRTSTARFRRLERLVPRTSAWETGHSRTQRRPPRAAGLVAPIHLRVGRLAAPNVSLRLGSRAGADDAMATP